MISAQFLSVLIVFPGSVFMFASLVQCIGMSKSVPEGLRAKWLAMTYLILFFTAGYLVFLVIELLDLTFPLELLTSTVFLGGAIFVFLVMGLSGITIRKVQESNERVREVNEALIEKNAQLETEMAARGKAEEEAQIRL